MDVVIVATASWLAAQLIKIAYYRYQNGWWNMAVLTSSGGMPSSHTSLVVAATVRIALNEGVFSSLFGFAVIMCMVIMYDATGVRQSVGVQAKTLNKIQEELKGLIAFDADTIKEVLGHTGFQVLCGLMLGLAIGFLSIFVNLP